MSGCSTMSVGGGVCSAAFRLLLPVIFLTVTDAANILVFMPIPLKSHFGGFRPMFEELANRGHNVTVVSSFPLTDRRIPNYTDINVLPPDLPEFNAMEFISTNIVITTIIRWTFSGMFSSFIEQKNVKKFIQSEENSFDLIIVESFLQEYTIALGHKFNAPVINLAPSMIWVSMSKWLHAPSTFSYIPDCCIGITDEMSFVERLKNTITGTIQMYVENYLYIPMIKKTMNEHFTYKGWESRPPLEEMLSNVSLTLVNAHFVTGVCRPFFQGIVEVGGMHIKEPKRLPKDLEDYIESAKDGVIFFSFGSIVNLSHLPEEKLNIFLSVIKKLKQKIIIKWVPDKNVQLPTNVKTGSWLPQNDILAHSNVKLFITHGGLHSIEEAVYNSIPIVGIPFFADQVSNMRIVEKNGHGKMITLSELTEESFENTISEVLLNPKFKELADYRSRLYKDQPMKPLDRAIYWIEYVIRNKGAEYLKSDSIGLNSAQYFLFDVISVITFSMVTIVWIYYRCLTKVMSKFKVD